MTYRLHSDVRDDMLAVIAAAADAGAGAATVEIRTGAIPANGNAAVTGTLLVSFTMADPCFEAPSGGSMAYDADPDINAVATATGTAGYAVLKDSTGAVVGYGTVGTSGADFNITSTSITSGQTVTFVSGSITMPAA